MRRILLFIFIGFTFYTTRAQDVLPSFGSSRTGGSGMQFLKISPDARSTAMGGAVIGLVNDVSALYWNPAGITSVDTGKVSIMASHTRYFANNTVNFAGVVFKPGKLSYVGVSVMSLNFADMEETTELQPFGTGRKVNVNNTLIGLTYAKILTQSFSFGMTGKWAHESFSDVQTNDVLFDLGLKYNIGLMGSRFGVSFSNFGMNVSPEGNVSVLKLSGEQKINNFSEVSAPAAFRVGVAFDPINKGMHKLTLAGQLNHPTDNNETFSTGAEYSLKRLLHVRTGWEFGADEGYNFPPIGMGIKLPYSNYLLSFDYSMVSKQRLGNLNRITLALTIR